jgi:uncharacterized protein YacL
VTPQTTINLLRILFVILVTTVGFVVGGDVFGSQQTGVAIGAGIGLVVVLMDLLLKGFSLRIFSSATFGLLLGFVLARLLLASNILKYLSEDMAWLIGVVAYATFGYLGMMLAIRSNQDEFALIIPYVRFRHSGVQDSPLLVDTNIIIDGRISEICGTGFLNGPLIVPRFVLDELQRLADSAEPLKRERGRRGLDGLNKMQRNPNLGVTIHEAELKEEDSVDTQLVQLAKMLQARLLTNDSNLCKIARLQNVPALNLNDLARAVRSMISPGDELELELVKEGREADQAVGYLPDGTMIVVNNARQFLGQTVEVTVSGTHQTSAGRLFFAEIKRP